MEKHSPRDLSTVRDMELKVSHCFIAVHDHEEALAFYRDVLGLEVRDDVEDKGRRWETVGARAQPDVNLVLELPAANSNASPDEKQAMSKLLANGMLGAVIFAIDDCDATFEHLCRAGIEVLQEPMDQGDGVRDCAFRDPSGNIVRFSQKQ
jgi:predicted enzyme related to lactoylglutathione lyase